MPLDERCCRNQFEFADDYCNRCGLPFSNEYLVYAFGPKKPPMCVSCSLALSGVRANAGNRPVVSKRELRKREKARKQQAKAAKQNAPKVSSKAVSIDWSLPDDLGEDDMDDRNAGKEIGETVAGGGEPAPGRGTRSAPPPPPSQVPAAQHEPGSDESQVSESLDWIERYAGTEPGDEPPREETPRTSKRITF